MRFSGRNYDEKKVSGFQVIHTDKGDMITYVAKLTAEPR